MNIETRKLADLRPAAYNPRRKLQPGEPEYEKIARSIEEFGYCDPIIINKDGTIIGGHQRHQVLLDLGAESADVVVVDLDPDKEKALNIALNKITGSWDEAKLTELIGDLDVEGYDLTKTGYSDKELKAMLEQTRIRPEDFSQDFTLPSREQVLTHTMNVTLHREQIAVIKAAIDVALAEGEGDTGGNTDRNGNGLSKPDEKALNIALNKIGGQWDMEKLREVLGELSFSGLDVTATGYSESEIAVVLGDTQEEQNQEDPAIDRVTFTLSLEQYANLQQALELIAAKYKPDQMETFGNTNRVGNRIYMVVKEWAEQRKLKLG